jgi:DNA (cytosine-5)-methyltransferase 1
MKAASCFSGIGAPELGGPQFDWVWCAEVEKFPSAVLAARFPHSVNLGDVTADDFLQRASAFGPLDLLVGGPPCQDFSVAGLRAGTAGDRGNLSLRFMEIAHAIRPRNLLVENVPGWLNMPDNAFGSFLGGLVGADDALRSPLDGKWPSAGMVAGPRARAAWRVFDAQYFGVAQRRRRVFVVADFGEGADPAAVLFERKSLSGNTAPRRETGTRVAALTSNGVGTCGADDNQAQAGHLIHCHDVAPRLNTTLGDKQGLEDQHINGGCGHFVAHSLRAEGFDASEDGTGRGTPIIPIDMRQASRGATMTNNRADGSSGGAPGTGIGNPGDPSPTLRSMGHDKSHANGGGQMAVAFDARQSDVLFYGDHTGPMDTGFPGPSIAQGWQVRRLTPTECERLQDFPDGFTDIEYRGKPAADGPRYKALGNSWAASNGEWILARLAALLDQRRLAA